MEDNNINQEQNTAFAQDKDLYGKPTKAVPKPEVNVGIDTQGDFISSIIEAGISSQLDLAKLESFTQVSQSRDQIYNVLDTMGEDSMVSAILETYAEDTTEYNDKGQIVWVESDNSDIANYVQWLLQSMNVDKNIYKWTYSLCKYGDLYLRLYRESEFEDPIFTKDDTLDALKVKPPKLHEDVKIRAYKGNDKYVHYLEMVSNPAEVFELTRHGKTCGYIKANVPSTSQKQDNVNNFSYYKYSFKKSDVDIYAATEFVHAALEDNSSRVPERVNIFTEQGINISDINSEEQKGKSYEYTVRRGQSLLYNVFKIWRELMLLENSVMLNRITKSSILRLINVEIGDMPKEQVGPHLQGIKQLIEQKSAYDSGSSMSEYTNPGPVENNVIVPTRDGKGTLSSTQIGGDVDVKSLADLDYFKNKFYGCLKGDTNICFKDGSKANAKELFEHIDSYIGKQLQGKNSDNTICDGTLTGIFETEVKKEFIRFTLEDGSYIEVTPEHRMMLSDGTFKQAKELTEYDDLMCI